MFEATEYLEKKYLAFVDVLGFSDLVNRIEFREEYDPSFYHTDRNTFGVIASYYRRLLIELLLEKDSNLEITTISDCIIISGKDCFSLLKFLFYLQSNMIYNDGDNIKIIMRGYLTKGNFIHNQKRNLIFGEAYQRALKGEKDTVFPRIEIDDRLIEELNQIPFELLITQDPKDSKYFVNYLIRKKFVDFSERRPLNEFIDKKIEEYRGKLNVQMKYIWLQEYHDRIKNQEITEQDKLKWSYIFSECKRDI